VHGAEGQEEEEEEEEQNKKCICVVSRRIELRLNQLTARLTSSA